MRTIEISEAREQIDLLASWDQDLSFFDQVGQLPGFSIVEQRNPWEDTDNNYQCAQYVFEKRMSDGFAHDYHLPRDFILNGSKYLRGEGFIEVEHPEPYDVVGYAQTTKELDLGELAFLLIAGAKFPIFRHWGIYVGGDMVESKFSVGHVYRHPLELVPVRYGTQVCFFRKS